MAPQLLWLRSETKPGEHRTPLVPADAAKLIQAGVQVVVEHAPARCFSVRDYEEAGCSTASLGQWVDAPPHAMVLGLKELPSGTAPLRHTHCYFAHSFKDQPHAHGLLARFRSGGGCLLDLEYLLDADRRRVAAFGWYAGFIGAALGVLAWAKAKEGYSLEALQPWNASADLTQAVQDALDGTRNAELPQLLITGAHGRSGLGARQLLANVGLRALEWDVEDTRSGGPFPAILEVDVLLHCVGLSRVAAPFLTSELVKRPRRLRTIVDVTCDAGSPQNLLPLYSAPTTLEAPIRRLVEGAPPLDLVAIDHLPSLLPRESSTDFSRQLLPHLLDFFAGPEVWRNARSVFVESLSGLEVRP